MPENFIDTGGPAFPVPIAEIQGHAAHAGELGPGFWGMSLRDYFAALALNGMLASDSSVDRTMVNKLKWARVAYAFADAMIAARGEF